MVNKKLYYEDVYQQSFSAIITKQERDEEGNWYIVLEQTAFYPTGGGQPHDIGTINGRNVVNVEELNGEIRHYIEAPLSHTENAATCSINWERRYDHMQQHAGQHILSAAFDHLFHYKTVSFHLGNDSLTIDIGTETLSDEEADAAEKLANQIILDNRYIEAKWVSEAELQQYALRKETKVKEDIRLVIIPDFDYNGCGGTHPKTTGEVRAVKILDWEKQKKNTRVEFICGERVLKQFHQKQKVLLDLTRLLSAPEKELSNAVTKLLQSGKDLEKALEHAEDRLISYEAKELLREAVTSNEGNVISGVFQNRSLQELQKLARLIITENQLAVVFFAAENDGRLQIVGARGLKAGHNMKNLIGEALSIIHGKGGGNDSFAQGGGEALVPGAKVIEILLNKLA